jgi:hypothetical protein
VAIYVRSNYNVVALTTSKGNVKIRSVLRVDKLVAKYFIDKINKTDIDIQHLDSNNLNDRFNNLKWIPSQKASSTCIDELLGLTEDEEETDEATEEWLTYSDFPMYLKYLIMVRLNQKFLEI